MEEIKRRVAAAGAGKAPAVRVATADQADAWSEEDWENVRAAARIAHVHVREDEDGVWVVQDPHWGKPIRAIIGGEN